MNTPATTIAKQNLPGWINTMNAIFDARLLNVRARRLVEHSDNSDSAYQILTRNIESTFDQAETHRLDALTRIDRAIETSDIVKKLKEEAKAAKEEAERFKIAAANVEKLTEFVGKLAGLVSRFGGLK
ncbi:hypothetical protein [Yoonia sp. SDW83-1]|uniref:hypothetical protein n=1 Tax=Yoonia sp. SDW83-1 TaxID=3366945 RepID=UPI00398C47FB